MAYLIVLAKKLSDDDYVWNYNDVGKLNNETDRLVLIRVGSKYTFWDQIEYNSAK